MEIIFEFENTENPLKVVQFQKFLERQIPESLQKVAVEREVLQEGQMGGRLKNALKGVFEFSEVNLKKLLIKSNLFSMNHKTKLSIKASEFSIELETSEILNEENIGKILENAVKHIGKIHKQNIIHVYGNDNIILQEVTMGNNNQVDIK